MSNFDDEDLEIEAIAKCAKALSRLDNESKTRVIRYLLDKYGFIDQSYKPTVPTNQFIGTEKQLPPTNKETKVETINAEPFLLFQSVYLYSGEKQDRNVSPGNYRKELLHHRSGRI